MKRAMMSRSSILLSGLLASGTALSLAGCDPEVVSGSDLSSSDAIEIGADGAVDCQVRLEATKGGWGELSLSNDDLTATTLSTMDIARASAGHITGKWYFEVHIDQLVDPFWAQNIGAAVDEVIYTVHDTARMGAVYNTDGSIHSTPEDFGPPSADKFGTGDLVGVALDLDGGKAYFHKNGVWQNGDPASSAGGAEILNVPGTGAYYPFLSMSEGDQMTASFGNGDFAYAAPAGFFPYADGFVADAAGDCVDPGPAGIPADPAPMTASCEGFTSYGAGSAGGQELHVVGVYESVGGPVNVQVDRGSPMVLVLASYDPVDWSVTVGPGAQIERIIMTSYELSSVSAPAGIPVETFIYEQTGEYLDTGYAWPSAPGGSDTQGLIKRVEAKSGLALTSFGGCYSGGAFTLTD